MKYIILLSYYLLIHALTIDAVNAQTTISFRCDTSIKNPQTVAKSKGREIILITWESNSFAKSGFTPERRCNEVSERLQAYSNSGSLRYITTGKDKKTKQNIICSARSKDGVCRFDGLILTLEPKDNPKKVLDTLFSSAFKVKGGSPLIRGERVVYDFKYLFEESN